MRINEAYVGGFGRLVERSFQFSPRVQLVVGANEVGKSTLQHFLLAMLFGLKREDRKRREYLPDYQRYLPWSGVDYDGRLVYELDSGRRFEVQRIFDKKSDAMRIVDAVTGKDLSQDFAMDSRKERPFLQHQLHLTRQLFEATTSLGQMKAQPAKGGVTELRERIEGLLASGDEAMSTGRAISSLKELRDSFGSERTPTRGIGLMLQQKQQLAHEREIAEQARTELFEIYRQRSDIIAQQQRAEACWKHQRSLEASTEYRNVSRRLEHVRAAKAQAGQLSEQLKGFVDVADLNESDYAAAREALATRTVLEHQAAEQRVPVTQLQNQHSELGAVAGRLTCALGNLIAKEMQQSQEVAEVLREDIGRVRETRRRHAFEMQENRQLVESLQRHRGRDWTQDEFMIQLQRHVSSSVITEWESVQADAHRQLECYQAHTRRLTRRVGVIAASLIVVALLMWANVVAWPTWVRAAVPSVGFVLLILALPARIRMIVGWRDGYRQSELHMERLKAAQKHSQDWIAQALNENNFATPADIFAARAEYDQLKIRSEQPLVESCSKDIRRNEVVLAQHAAELKVFVNKCDWAELHHLRETAPQSALVLALPIEEKPAQDICNEDSPEIIELQRDLEKLPEVQHAFEWCQRIHEAQNRLEAETHAAQGRLEETLLRYQTVDIALNLLLVRNNVTDVADFKKQLERWRQRQALLDELQQLHRDQASALGDQTIEALQERCDSLARSISPEWARTGASHRDTLFASSDIEPSTRIGQRTHEEPIHEQRSLEEWAEEVERLTARRAQFEERLTLRENQGRRPSEVDLALAEVEEKLTTARIQDEALVLSAETLLQVSGDMYREVAPAMNRRVGEIFSRLAVGHSREVCLDEDLTPRVRMNDQAIRGVENLSGGAADQLYFALRITAGEQLARAGESLPLLLDDPFVQYDPERLDAALDLICDLAGQHQIFFFTCETSQARALEDKVETHGIPFKTLHLGAAN